MTTPIQLITRGIARLTMRDPLLKFESPSAIAITLAFTSTAALELDLGTFIDDRKISCVKTLYVDNSANAYALTVVNVDTQQSIQFPPYAQGYMNILSGQRPRMQFICLAGIVSIPIQLINIEMQPNIWTVLGGTTVSITGIVDTKEVATSATDLSGTFTTGGVAQLLITGASTTVEAWVNNPHATDDLAIRIGNSSVTLNGSGSITIPAGMGWAGKVTNSIYGISATTGRPYSAGVR